MKKVLIILLCLCMIFCGCQKKENTDIENAFFGYQRARIAQYEIENAEYEDYECDVAFLGDSLTDGYDLKKFYPQYSVVNRGINGDRTTWLEGRLQVSLFDLKPKVAVMLIGANNFDTMFDNYENILISFTENVAKTKIILLSLTSMGGSWAKNNQLAAFNNVKIKILAEKYGFEFVDLYSALLNIETNEIYAEYTSDGGHLTNLGYQVVTEKVTPVIEKQLSAWYIENQE